MQEVFAIPPTIVVVLEKYHQQEMIVTMHQLATTAQALVTGGKGILAADESLPTIQKRFSVLNIPSTEENRKAYRELLFSTRRIEEYISGVILFDETLRQKTASGAGLTELLARKGIIPGIKVDKGAVAVPRFPGDKITQGLDGLRERLREYAGLGARFTKWRAVVAIGKDLPHAACIRDNARLLALFALFSQEAGLVPVVEPEVLMDGDHDSHRCEAVTSLTLATVFDALREHGVLLEGMLLKPNMVLSGKECARQATPSETADATIRTLRRTVPPAVPGIVFLSGGQTPEQATAHLNIMNARGPHPWQLSFSFGRALQQGALSTWKGSDVNRMDAQRELLLRARLASAACYGTYSNHMEKLVA